MASDTVVRARIDAGTKQEAAEALKAMGLTISDAIRLLLVQVAAERQLPFPIKVPNAATREAMDELEAEKGRRYSSKDELFEDLGL